MPRLDVRPEAERDALDAASWYDGERLGLGSEFLTELRATFAQIEASAQQYPLAFHECRRAILRRFPFGVFFIADAGVATVLAIAHLHRHPDVWRTRV